MKWGEDFLPFTPSPLLIKAFFIGGGSFFLTSIVAGIIGGVDFFTLLVRGILFGILGGILGGGGVFLIEKFVPALKESKEEKEEFLEEMEKEEESFAEELIEETPIGEEEEIKEEKKEESYQEVLESSSFSPPKKRGVSVKGEEIIVEGVPLKNDPELMAKAIRHLLMEEKE